ncbi:MAG: FlgO family outer membrane protein, partial [Terriglobales bacterium]
RWARHRVAIGVLVCIAIAALAWFGWRATRAPGVEAGPAHSLAILPLNNLSGDSAQEYFADGFTQELTTELAQVSELRVISHTSVQRYKNTHKSVPEIVKELQVDAVIEGSVSRSGDRVRVAAQLIRVPSERAVWATSYERDLRDTLSLQRDIAKDIAEQVKIKLTHTGQSSSSRPLDRQAHDLIFRACITTIKVRNKICWTPLRLTKKRLPETLPMLLPTLEWLTPMWNWESFTGHRLRRCLRRKQRH